MQLRLAYLDGGAEAGQCPLDDADVQPAADAGMLVGEPWERTPPEVLTALVDDGDEGFLVSWSLDGHRFTPVATLPPGAEVLGLTVELGVVTEGPLWVRLVDTDRSPGAAAADEVAVDELVVLLSGSPEVAPTTAGRTARRRTRPRSARRSPQRRRHPTVERGSRPDAPLARDAAAGTPADRLGVPVRGPRVTRTSTPPPRGRHRVTTPEAFTRGGDTEEVTG